MPQYWELSHEGGLEGRDSVRNHTAEQNAVVQSAWSGAVSRFSAATYLLCDLPALVV